MLSWKNLKESQEIIEITTKTIRNTVNQESRIKNKQQCNHDYEINIMIMIRRNE